MKIRTGLTWLLCFLTFIFMSVVIIHRNYEQNRLISLLKSVQVERESIFDKILVLKRTSLQTLSFDYSFWDEMVNFVTAPDEKWALENINVGVTTYKANAAWVYNVDCKLVYSFNNLESGGGLKEIPIPKAAMREIFTRTPFCHFFVNTSKGLMEFYGATIQPSSDIKRETPVKGYFFCSRLWDKSYLDELSELTSSTLVIADTVESRLLKSGQNTISFSRALTGWDNKPVKYLVIFVVSRGIEGTKRAAAQASLLLIIFSVSTLTIVYFFVTFWIDIPLSLISLALKKEDPIPLKIIDKQRTEFGDVSRLMGNFFTQRKKIIQEITERKKMEAEREILLKWQMDISLLQQSLLESAAFDKKLKSITDSIVSIFDADFCRIWIISPGDLCEQGCVHAEVREGPHICRFRDKCLHLMASSGRYTHIDGKGHRRVPFDCYKIGLVASGKEHKFLTNDVVNDLRVHNHEWARELGLVSFAGYQLRIPRGETIGVLALFAKHPILPTEDAAMDSLSTTTAFVIQQAVTDGNLELQTKKLDDALKDSLQSRDILVSMLADNNQIRERLEKSLEELKEAQAQLIHSEKMEAVGRMASGVAHEVKNPLGIILQGINYFEGTLPPEAKDNREMLQMMKNSVKRADSIVRALLDFSRTEELKIEEQEINTIIESSIDLVQHRLRFNSIESVCELGKDLPKVLMDRGKIEQVFVNLFNNAVDAMPKGGKLYVRSYLSELKTTVDKIGARKEDIFRLGEEVIIVEIEDTGMGIDEDIMKKVFDPFFTTKNRTEGTGLGLSIAKSLIEMHKSLINVESRKGKGTKFTIIFKRSGKEELI